MDWTQWKWADTRKFGWGKQRKNRKSRRGCAAGKESRKFYRRLDAYIRDCEVHNRPCNKEGFIAKYFKKEEL